MDNEEYIEYVMSVTDRELMQILENIDPHMASSRFDLIVEECKRRKVIASHSTNEDILAWKQGATGREAKALKRVQLLIFAIIFAVGAIIWLLKYLFS